MQIHRIVTISVVLLAAGCASQQSEFWPQDKAHTEALRDARQQSRARAYDLYSKIMAGQMSPSVFRAVLDESSFYLNARSNGTTLLYDLINAGAGVAYIRILLAAGADPNIPSGDGGTPLMLASFQGDFRVAKALIAAGADVSGKADNGWTVLHHAVSTIAKDDPLQAGRLILLLIHAGADINAQTDAGVTPLMGAVTGNLSVARQVLLAQGANPNLATYEGRTPLIEAVYQGDLKAVKALIEAGANPNLDNKNGQTALHFTVIPLKIGGDRSHDPQIASLLIEAGADINARARNGATSLMLAVINGRSRVRKVLLQTGADPNIPSFNGNTPLMEAVYRGNVAAVRALLVNAVLRSPLFAGLRCPLIVGLSASS